MLDRYLKYGLLLSVSLLVGALIWLIINYLKVFSLFPIISFLALLSYTIFIVRLYLNNINSIDLKWINWVVLLILSLPVFVAIIQFFDTSFYENYWPVVILLITIQSVLGLMAALGYFVTRKNTPFMVSLVVLLAGLYSVFWSFLVLTKSVVNEVKSVSFFVLLGLTIVVILVNAITFFKKSN
jgi:hypothetical protein